MAADQPLSLSGTTRFADRVCYRSGLGDDFTYGMKTAQCSVVYLCPASGAKGTVSWNDSAGQSLEAPIGIPANR